MVNKEAPNHINTKEEFMNQWFSVHGLMVINDFNQSREVRSIDKLSDEFFLVVSVEKTEKEGQPQSRPISSIFIKNSQTGTLQIFHVHECHNII